MKVHRAICLVLALAAGLAHAAAARAAVVEASTPVAAAAAAVAGMPSDAAAASKPDLGADPAVASVRRTSPRDRPPATSAVRASAGLGLDLRLPSGTSTADAAPALRIVLGLTLLAVLPALLVCVTGFLRIIIVLSMLRHAIGMPETPPNTVLVGLALFLTLFTMAPALDGLNRDALQPFLQGQIGTEAAYTKASKPLREFMARQTREQDIALMVDLSKAPRPQSMDDVSNVQLVPAFMLSELRAAFQISFLIFLPFLLIDLIVSSVLMALGMMMMPPVTVALPLKLLMFILVDGWSLILKALVGSFH